MNTIVENHTNGHGVHARTDFQPPSELLGKHASESARPVRMAKLVPPKKSIVPLFIIAGLLLVAGGVAYWFGRPTPTVVVASAPAAVPVTVAAAVEKSVTEWDEYSGRLRAIDRVEIRPQVSGTIQEIHFSDGQMVKQGDLLFVIDQRPFQAALARAKADLASAEARQSLAKLNLDRGTKLIQDRAIPQSDLDQQTEAMQDAEASVQADQAEVQTAQLNLDYTTISAPVAGRVSRAEVTLGNLVGAGVTAPVLTTIVSVSPVYAEFEMDEPTFLRYAANGAAGNTGVEKIPVSLELTGEQGFPHSGRIDSLDNQVDTSSGTIRVRAVFDNPTGELVPGLYAKIRTAGSAEEKAVLIDDKAIGTDQDKKYVLVVGSDNKAGYRTITIGPMVDGYRVVRTGLAAGEKIIVNGLQRVRPNSLVAPTEEPMDQSIATVNP